MSLKMKFDGLRRFLVPNLPHAVKTPKSNDLVNFLGELAEKVDMLDAQVPRVLSVAVTGTATVADNATTQLTATATTQGGLVTTAFTWTSSATGTATVNSSGLVSGVAAGTVTITATSVYDPSVSGSLVVTVTAS